jgi:precorrin-6A synthase
VLVVGIGAGGEEHLTLEAARVLGEVDCVVLLDKGDELADLAALRHRILARHARPDLRTRTLPDPPRRLGSGDYSRAVSGWHDQRAALLADALADELAGGGTTALLVWGDPSLYDSSLRVLEQVRTWLPWPVEVRVVPGVSSLHLLTAAHGIALNRVGASVRLTTGRRLRDEPPGPDCDVVVFLDSRHAFAKLDPEQLHIYWGAYLGSPEQLLVAGPLAECRDEIVRVRTEARQARGWMFDTYLLRWQT